MTQFEAFDEGVEVNGQTVLSVVEGAGQLSSVFEEQARTILADNGIDEPQPDEWYPQQAWLESFREIADEIGRNTLTQIGKQIPENAEWPPEVDSLEGGLESINDAYHMNHRGGDIGSYRCESFSEEAATVRCENPYPCSFDRGIVKAVATEFSPPASFVQIDEQSSRCRADGGNACEYRVTW